MDEFCLSGAESLAWYLQQPVIPRSKLVTQRPDFLIVSPPKTASTWLAANLRAHPDIFIPDIKELKYFSSFFKWLDLDWYLDHFAPAGARLKGEASPSYACLPVERIRLVRRIMPDVKIIYLMRDPIARAWSHAKHSFGYKEASFASFTGSFESVPENRWRDSLASAWLLASGDYLGQLRRWLSVFPREQIYIGFQESIVTAPEALFREILAFLGCDADVDLSHSRLAEKVLPGLPGELPVGLDQCVRHLLGGRTRELMVFLREQLGLRVPQAWRTYADDDKPAGPADEMAFQAATIFGREFDDRFLVKVLAQEERFTAEPRLVFADYRGYDFFLSRGQLYAVERTSGSESLGERALAELQAAGSCIMASSAAKLRECVNERISERTAARLREAEAAQAALRETSRQAAVLEKSLEDALHHIHQLEERLCKVQADAVRLAPLHVLAVRFIRKRLRRLRSFFGPTRFERENEEAKREPMSAAASHLL